MSDKIRLGWRTCVLEDGDILIEFTTEDVGMAVEMTAVDAREMAVGILQACLAVEMNNPAIFKEAMGTA